MCCEYSVTGVTNEKKKKTKPKNLCWLSAVSITTPGSVEYDLFDFSTLAVIRLKARGQLIWLLSWRLEERIFLKVHLGLFSRFLYWEHLKGVLEVCMDSTLIVICTINPLKIWYASHISVSFVCGGCVTPLCINPVMCSRCSGGRVPLFSNISIP